MSECKNCKKFIGDCGNHHKDAFGHTNYEIPSIACTTRTGNCDFYEETRTKRKIVLSELERKYLDTHNYFYLDEYLGQAIKVIKHLSDDEFLELLEERGSE